MDIEEKENTKKSKIHKKAIARKIFTVTKAKVGHTNLKYSNKKSVIEERMKKTNDEEIVNKAKKISDLNELKRLYYNEEDYQTEVNMVEAKVYGPKLEIIKGLLLIRIKEFKNDIQNLSYEKDVLELNENNNDEGDFNSEDFKAALNIFRNNIQNSESYNYEDDENVNKVEKFLTINTHKTSTTLDYNQVINKIDESLRMGTNTNNIIESASNINNNLESSNIITTNNIINENKPGSGKTSIYSGRESVIRGLAHEAFKNNLEKSRQFLNEADSKINELNKEYQDDEIINGKNFAEVYKLLGEKTTQSQDQFGRFMEMFKVEENRNMEKILLELIPVVACLVKENIKMKEILKDFMNYLRIKQNNDVLEAKKGNKNEFNNEIIKSSNIDKLKQEGKFIDEEEWRKKSLCEKIITRFHFNDFIQNPYYHAWVKFNKEEKVRFAKLKLEWRRNRINEILNFDFKNKNLYKIANNFDYYEWRDPDGNLLPIQGATAELSFYDKELLAEKDKLKQILNQGSSRGYIRGIIKQNGEIKLTRGKAWFHMAGRTGSLLGKKRLGGGNRNINNRNFQ